MNNNVMNQKEIVVIGGGYAGTLAALRLAGKTKNLPGRVTLINGLDHFVERIRLHQLAADQEMKERPFAQLLEKTGIRFIQGWVQELDLPGSRVLYQDRAGQKSLPFDYLVYALGSSVDTVSVPGIKEHALTLGSEHSARQLQHVLPVVARHQGRLLVVGGGLTGIEAASEIAETYPGLGMTLITEDPLGSDLSPAARDYLQQTFAGLGVELIERRRISRLESFTAYDQDGQAYPFDVCLWAGSFRVPSLARECGLPVDGNGRIAVQPTLQVQGLPPIYAVGDAAAVPLRMACATAMPMAAYAADHLVARLKGQDSTEPFRFAYALQCISLGRNKALIQTVNGDDSPKDRIFTGRLGALIKENVCRYAYWSILLEKGLPGSYWWPKADLSSGAQGRNLPLYNELEMAGTD